MKITTTDPTPLSGDETVSAAEANRQFSKLLRDVAAGRTYVVTSDGRPVVRMSPADASSEAERLRARERLWRRLMSQPAIEPGIGRWSREEINDREATRDIAG